MGGYCSTAKKADTKLSYSGNRYLDNMYKCQLYKDYIKELNNTGLDIYDLKA